MTGIFDCRFRAFSFRRGIRSWRRREETVGVEGLLELRGRFGVRAGFSVSFFFGVVVVSFKCGFRVLFAVGFFWGRDLVGVKIELVFCLCFFGGAGVVFYLE